MRMHMRVVSRAACARQALVGLRAAAVCVVVLSCIGGCQGRREPRSRPAQILLDSSLAGNEAMYDSATANLAMDRLACLEDRARSVLGHDEVLRIAREADKTVRARHSQQEYAAGSRGIGMFHDEPTAEFCTRIDSLWYATVVKQRKPRK